MTFSDSTSGCSDFSNRANSKPSARDFSGAWLNFQSSLFLILLPQLLFHLGSPYLSPPIVQIFLLRGLAEDNGKQHKYPTFKAGVNWHYILILWPTLRCADRKWVLGCGHHPLLCTPRDILQPFKTQIYGLGDLFQLNLLHGLHVRNHCTMTSLKRDDSSFFHHLPCFHSFCFGLNQECSPFCSAADP